MVQLFKKPENLEESEEWKAPIPGMEEVWVRLVPPTWDADRQRQSFINNERESALYSFLDVFQLEIWLTYGGTNMVIVVPKRDENGKVIWKPENEFGCVTEIVKFDEGGKLTIEEFADRIGKLPAEIVDYWHTRVLEVAPQWSPFRQPR